MPILLVCIVSIQRVSCLAPIAASTRYRKAYLLPRKGPNDPTASLQRPEHDSPFSIISLFPPLRSDSKIRRLKLMVGVKSRCSAAGGGLRLDKERTARGLGEKDGKVKDGRLEGIPRDGRDS
jgi:hypothetical protein